VNATRHAHLARQLIAACGGLIEAASADGCRLEKSRLSEFCDPKSGAFMPADVMAALEAYCGEPLYSRAICEERPANVVARHVLTETCEAAELSLALQQLVRLATEDGSLDATEKMAIEKLLAKVEDQTRKVRTAMDGGGAS
jgi:hypothetical protein